MELFSATSAAIATAAIPATSAGSVAGELQAQDTTHIATEEHAHEAEPKLSPLKALVPLLKRAAAADKLGCSSGELQRAGGSGAAGQAHRG